ncbi:MAG: dihydroorotate dehydrogenase electron transfer subunit [Clostridia bacterium]|nr:dihydroorotate dehydrogenase electron transfer subunit [Clostridia bacterium]
MKDLISTVIENREIAENINLIKLHLSEEVGTIHGGHFVNLSTGDNTQLLRRPLGVCKVDGQDVTLCYQIKGKGTKKLKEAKAGDTLKVLLPLGNYFDLSAYKNVAVIGGGVGVFPLIATVRENADKKFFSYIGFRNKNAVCLLEEFEKSEKLTVTTDDGSYGTKGNAVQAFLADEKNIKADVIIACGPPVMLRALKAELTARKIDTPCLVSLEERMGCGIGACLVCVCKTSDGKNARVCKDGPVFNINDVEL